LKCMHEVEWDTCTVCYWPGYHKRGDQMISQRWLCSAHDLTTPDKEVEACFQCWALNVKVPEKPDLVG